MEGTFKIPPNRVFEKRQKKMKKIRKKDKQKYDRIPDCYEENDSLVGTVSEISIHHV